MRPVHILFVAIFSMSIGFGMMTPAVSLYSVIGFGVNDLELGMLGALTSVPYAIAPAFLGKYSDKVGRKPLALCGVCIYSAVALAYISAPNVAFLAFLRVIEGVCFSLIWPACEAWVGDLSTLENRKRMIGNYSVSWSAGYMVGPFLLGLIVTFASIAYVFVVAAFMVISSVPIFLKVKNSVERTSSPASSGNGGGRIATLAVLFAMVVWGIAQLAYFFLLPSYALGIGFPAAYAGYLIGTVALLRTVIFVSYPWLIARLGGWMLAMGALLIAASMFITWLARDIVLFALASCMLGIAFGAIYAFSLDHVLDRPAKGLYAGFFESAIGIGQIAGPLSMGYIGFAVSPSSPYLAMGLLGIASAAAISGALLRARKIARRCP